MAHGISGSRERKLEFVQLDMGDGVNIPQIQGKPGFNSAAQKAIYSIGSCPPTEEVVS